jgi:hypothetical protein
VTAQPGNIPGSCTAQSNRPAITGRSPGRGQGPRAMRGRRSVSPSSATRQPYPGGPVLQPIERPSSMPGMDAHGTGPRKPTPATPGAGGSSLGELGHVRQGPVGLASRTSRSRGDEIGPWACSRTPATFPPMATACGQRSADGRQAESMGSCPSSSSPWPADGSEGMGRRRHECTIRSTLRSYDLCAR